MDTPEYHDFALKDLFEVSGSKTTPLKELSLKTETDIFYPYVTTKSGNNGIDGFFKYYTEDGNVITVDSATDGQIHYQSINFSASDHVELLKPKFKLNKYIGLFLKTAIKIAIAGNYNYGYKFNQERIKNQKVLLPVNDNGEPDWVFMENYMRKVESELLEKYFNHLNKSNKMGGVKPIQWVEFNLSDVFDIQSTNSGIDKNKIQNIEIIGRYPYLTRSKRCNGIDLFLTKQDYDINEGNVITIGLDTQTVFYQPNRFYTGQNIQVLSNEFLNKYNALFLVSLLKTVLTKFNWGGNGATLTRLKNSRVLLPVTSDGDIDYEFMENYMMQVESQLLKKYLDYKLDVDK